MSKELDSTLEECRAHNEALEQSPEFQRIVQEMDKEVFTQFALERIRVAEQYFGEHGYHEEPECDYEFEFGDEPESSGGKPLVSDEVDDAFARNEKYLRKLSNRIKEAKRLLEVYPDQPGTCSTFVYSAW